MSKLTLTLELFNSLTEDDFYLLYETGKLETLCFALSIDLQTQPHEENIPYEGRMA